MIGRTISHYRITARLGAGAMGEVYLAEDTALKRQVALKFIPASADTTPEITARFQHEAQAAAALSHPNVATIYEVAEHEGRPYIVMEYIDGPTLAKYCEAQEPDLPDILGLAIQIGEGLKDAHEAGIVHRDLKPANILTDRRDRPKILDFGLAKLKGATKVTKTGSTLGTAAYMSPEQAQGQEVDHRTDIWSFGVILYEMIARRLPFDAEHEAALAYAVTHEEPEPLARYKAVVSDDLQRIVSKCLAKNPAERYQSAADVVADLQTLRRTSAGSSPGVAPRRKRSGYATVGLAAVILIIAAVWGGMQLKQWLAPARLEAKSLAVVDFDNIGAQEDAYLASGLAEGLALKLRQLEGVRVASSADVRRLTRENLLPREVAARLNVQYALGGSLLRQDSLVRISVDLIDKESGDVVWSDQIDKQFTEIFQFLDEVSLRIVQALEVRLSPVERAAMAAKPADNTVAYDHYLKGRHYYYNITFRDNELAERELERALQSDPDYPLALAGLADVYVQRYKERYDYDDYWLDSSRALVQRALALDPDLAEAYESRAELLLQKNNTAGALEAAEQARTRRPDWDEPYVHLGDIFRLRGERSKAMAMYDTAIRLRPSVDALCGVGQILQTRGHMDSARAAFERAMQLNPNHDRPYLELASLYAATYKDDKVDTLLRRAIEVRPDHVAGYEQLTQRMYRHGSVQGGEDLLREFVRQYPYNWDGYQALYHYAAAWREDYPTAFRIIEEAVSHNPKQARTHMLLAQSYAAGMSPLSASGDLETASKMALAAMERALALRPNSGEMLYMAGSVLISLGRPDAAMEYLTRALETESASSDVLNEIATTLWRMARYEVAAEAARRAVEQSPGHRRYYVYLRESLLSMGKWQEYFEIIQHAAGEYGDDPGFLEDLSQEQRLAGQYQEAIHTCRRALAVRRDHSTLVQLGIALWLSGDPEGALTALREARDDYSTSYWIVRILKSMGRFSEIEAYLAGIKEATPGQVSGIDHWADVASTYYWSMRRYDDALAVLVERRESSEEVYPNDNTWLMAECYKQKGELDSARHLFTRLLDVTISDYRPYIKANLAMLQAVTAPDLKASLGLAEEAHAELNVPSDFTTECLLRLRYACGKTDNAESTLEKMGRRGSMSGSTSYRKPQLVLVTGSRAAKMYLDEAISSLTRNSRGDPHHFYNVGSASSFLALALARAGDPDEARRQIERAMRLEPESQEIAYNAACAYSLVGDTTLALQWLATAVERGHLELWWARVDPDLDALRALPRFKQIMADWDRRIQALVS